LISVVLVIEEIRELVGRDLDFPARNLLEKTGAKLKKAKKRIRNIPWVVIKLINICAPYPGG
jgi:hypothetical protein